MHAQELMGVSRFLQLAGSLGAKAKHAVAKHICVD